MLLDLCWWLIQHSTVMIHVRNRNPWCYTHFVMSQKTCFLWSLCSWTSFERLLLHAACQYMDLISASKWKRVTLDPVFIPLIWLWLFFPPTSFFSFNVAHHCIKGDIIFLSPSSSRHLPRWIASDWSGEQTGSVPPPQASAVCLYGADGSATSHFLHPGALQAGTLRRVDDAFGKCQKTKFHQCFLSLWSL